MSVVYAIVSECETFFFLKRECLFDIVVSMPSTLTMNAHMTNGHLGKMIYV